MGTYLLILIVGAGIIAALERLYHIMPLLVPLTTDGRVAAFDLDGEGSLAVWFSSMTLRLCRPRGDARTAFAATDATITTDDTEFGSGPPWRFW